MRIRIGTKLIGAFVLIVIVMVFLALYLMSESQKSLEESVGKDCVSLAEGMLKGMNQGIYLMMEELQSYCGRSLLQESLSESNRAFEKLANIEEHVNQKNREWVSAPKDEITPFMQELISTDLSKHLRGDLIEFYHKKYGYKPIVELIVTNRYGANIAQTGKTSDYRQDDEEWWQIAREKGHYISDVEYDESTGEYAVSLGMRIGGERGDFIGVMKAVVAVKSIIRSVEIAVIRYETTRIQLITIGGRLIYGTGVFKLLEDVSGKTFFKQLKGEKGIFNEKAGGRERLYSYARSKGYRDFEGLGWILVVGHDVQEILTPVSKLRNRMMAASLILITIVIIIAFLIARSITRPIAKLTKSAEIIGKGDLEHRVELKTRDEIGELAASFNRMADNLKGLQEELTRKDKLAILGQLAGGVGHELRNPLGVISNAIYYLKTILPDTDETTREYLNIISSEVARSNKIISDLLDLSRTRPTEREEVAVSRLVAQVLEQQSPPENIKVVMEIPSELPLLFVDPRQIHQALVNLVTNAFQAMPEGGRVTIIADELRLDASVQIPKSKIRIRVSDTGTGISRENMEKLFEPLFTTKASGIGLGLAVSKSLVQANSGSIEVESPSASLRTGEEGRGSTFTVILPSKEAVS